MKIVAWFDNGIGEPQCHLQGVTSTEVLTASLALRLLAVDLQEGETHGVKVPAGRHEGGAIPLGEGAAAVQESDVVLEMRWPDDNPREPLELDWQRCTSPTAGQVWACSAMLDEVGRHTYRMRLVQQAAEEKLREQEAQKAIERVAGRLGKA